MRLPAAHRPPAIDDTFAARNPIKTVARFLPATSGCDGMFSRDSLNFRFEPRVELVEGESAEIPIAA